MFEHRCPCGQRRVSIRRAGVVCPRCAEPMRSRAIVPPSKRLRYRLMRSLERLCSMFRLR